MFINILLANLDLYTAIQNFWGISCQGRDLLAVLLERRNVSTSPFSYPFSANLGPHEDDFLTYACFPGCGCDSVPSDYKPIICRGSYFHLTRANEIRYFNPILEETFLANVFSGICLSPLFPETIFGRGITPGKLAVESLFLYALAKTQISLREILSKVGYRTYHYQQLHLLAQRLMTVVPLPLHVLYYLLPGLYQPRYFPRRLGIFDSSQSLVFGIKDYIADLPPLLLYNGVFESREDFWFALAVILIDNNLPCEVRSVGTEVPFFTGEVIPYYSNCDEFAKYYSAFDTLTVRPENIVPVEREYYRQKKLRFLVLLFKLFLTRGDLFL